MRQWLRPHLTYANVMVTILAFIVLGGMSYAASGGNFILGQSNSASSTTALTRTGANAGKGLQVTNMSTSAGATALGLNEQCVAGIGEFNWAPGPVDQFHSELAFQLLNLLTQRRLGDVESLRGAAEVAFLGHGDEVAKQAHLRIDHISRI